MAIVIVSPVYGFQCGRYRSEGSLSFAEYIFNYPNYQISRCQNKSKYCPSHPPLRRAVEAEGIEIQNTKNQPASFSIQSNLFVFLSVTNNIQPTKPNTTASAAGAAATATAGATATAVTTAASGAAAAAGAVARAVWMTSGLR